MQTQTPVIAAGSRWLLLVALGLLAACGGGDGADGADGADGGGGGGAAVVDPPVLPPAAASRQARVQYDYDNNGTADAEETLGYDASGRLIQKRYRYSGDGLADRFNPLGTDAVDEDISHDAAGRVAQVRIGQVSGSTRFSFVYAADNLAERADLQIVSNGSTYDGQRPYTRAGGLLVQAQTLLAGQVLSTDSYSHDAAGRRNRHAQSSAGGAPVVTDYVWNADGSLAQVRRDLDADGSDVRYTLSYQDGRQTRSAKTVAGLPAYTVDFVRDAQGRVTQARFDRNADGSVDAVWTVTWEAATCRSIRLPEFDPLLNAVTALGSSASGVVDPCGT